MVAKTTCFCIFVLSVLVFTTVAKPFREENAENDVYYTEDTIMADSPLTPPKLRMNRHGKRGLFEDSEEDDLEGDNEGSVYYPEDTIAADSPGTPPKIRMNRHGKRGFFDGTEERDFRDPPKIRMNRHGKRGLFGNMEEGDFEGETEYDLYDTRDLGLADSPQSARLRMNRHGK